MEKLNSITYKITGLMFLVIALTVFVLIYMANAQMTDLFQEYLTMHNMGMDQMHRGVMMMGPHENNFLTSVHTSLVWVGLGILVIGLGASYILARSITVPLRDLSHAAEEIEKGSFGHQVPIETKDEVGHLATVFNRMSDTLATNTKLRKQLLANIAHEINTPLAIIQGNLEGMLDGVIEPSKEQLQSLFEEAVRLNRLIKDLRELSLAEVRQLTLEKHPEDINKLLNRAVSMIKPLADEKSINVSCQLDPSLPKVCIDHDRMGQVFYNLLINAVRYSPTESNVIVSSGLTDENGRKWLTARIIDNGFGIAEEDIPHIFDYFYRSDKSRDRKRGGSGLGLAIAKQLVENHDGMVKVKSKQGKGSEFIVYLPIKSA